MSLIKENPHVTQTEIAYKLECSERKIKRIMKIMADKGLLKRIGGRKMGDWKIVK